MFRSLIEEKVKDLTEEQIQRIPITNVNIFTGDYLRILNVRHRDGEAVLEDGFATIPERPVESSTDDEEWTNNNAGSSEIVVTKVVKELDIDYFQAFNGFFSYGAPGK